MTASSYSHRFRCIPREAMIQYFENTGAEQVADGVFKIGGGDIVIGKTRYSSLGSLKVNDVEITFHLEEAAYQEIMKKFRLQFIRAGG